MTLAEVFRRYGPAYREQVGARLPARQRAGYCIWTWWIIRHAPFDQPSSRFQTDSAYRTAVGCPMSVHRLTLRARKVPSRLIPALSASSSHCWWHWHQQQVSHGPASACQSGGHRRCSLAIPARPALPTSLNRLSEGHTQ